MKRLITLLVLLTIVAAACGSSTSNTAGSDDQTEGTTVTLPGGPDDPDAPEEEGDGGDSQTDEPGVVPDLPDLAADEVVFVWTENGGCMQGGPNCARYEILADGTVNTYRVGEDEVSVTGSVDGSLVNEWLIAVASTDVDALRGRLGPGEMTAAFDGVDFVLEAPYAELLFDSVVVEFAAGEPLFEAANGMAKAAVEAAPLEMEMR